MPRPKNKYDSINAYLPIQMGNIEILIKGTDLRADRIRAVYHQYYLKRLADSGNNKLTTNDKYLGGWVSLHTFLLKKIGTNEYKKYLDFLEKKGLILIRRDNKTGGKKYSKNGESQQFKIPDFLLNNPNGIRHFRKEKITDHCTLKSIRLLKESFRKSIKNVALNSNHLQLKEMLKHVRFDMKGAEAFLKKLENREIVLEEYTDINKVNNHREILLLMDAINEGNYERTTVDLFGGRFHTPITNLWKQLRTFIYFENNSEKLVSLDFSNSQPFFSSIAINANLIENILPEFAGIIQELQFFSEKEDFKTFAKLCASGRIYEEWMIIRGIESNKEGRNKAKSELFLIMFDKKRKRINSKKSKHKDFYDMLRVFANNFPSVYSCFYKIKSFDENKLPFIKNVFTNKYGMFEGKKSYHKVLACMMQRMESRIVLNKIVPKLIEANLIPFITIHDSFILLGKFELKAVEIIHNEFKTLCVNPPKIKREKLSK